MKTTSNPEKPGQVHKIKFLPKDVTIEVSDGETLLRAARSAGIRIHNVCAGTGICGKCQMRIESGTDEETGIHSTTDHVSPLSNTEEAIIEILGLGDDIRIGCQAHIIGDLVVTVLSGFNEREAAIRKKTSRQQYPVNPVITLETVRLRDVALQPGLDEWMMDEVAKLVPLSPKELTLTYWNEVEPLRVQAGVVEAVYGAAVDIGTTSVVLHLCNLVSGEVAATVTALNPQILYGEDIMSRVSYCQQHTDGTQMLHDSIMVCLNRLAGEAAELAGITTEDIVDVCVVGNSVMHHLFLNLDPTPLGQYPFTPQLKSAFDGFAVDLGWNLNPRARVHVLPLIAGFVGADTVGAMLAARPQDEDQLTLLIDVGTNGELVLGNKDRLIATSSPTGPAFEGGQMTHGMRAATGAIERIRIDCAAPSVKVKIIGSEGWCETEHSTETEVKGICGSGILEAVGEAYRCGVIDASGRMDSNHPLVIDIKGKPALKLMDREHSSSRSDILVTQGDVRAIQLAKAALHAGALILMQQLGIDHVEKIQLAGAFGSVLDRRYALMLGMLPDCPIEQIQTIGNAAGEGACLALLDKSKRVEAAELATRVEHITTPIHDEFQEQFVAAITIPHATEPMPNARAMTELLSRDEGEEHEPL